MALWDKVKQGIDKAGKAAQDVFDEGKLRIEAYRAREQADKAAEALGYAIFRAQEAGGALDADAQARLIAALKERDDVARKLEKELADAKAAGAAGGTSGASGASGASSADVPTTTGPVSPPPGQP